MLGTRISVTDTSIQDKVDRVILPVMSGLVQAMFLTAGGDGKNYAPSGSPVPVINGNPVQSTFSKSFPTSSDYIDTKHIDNTDITIVVVCKPAPLPSGISYSQIIGSWNLREAVETGKGGGVGIGIVQTTSNNVQLILSTVPTADANNPLASTGKAENRPVSGLAFDGTRRNMFLRFTAGESYFKEYVKNRESGSTAVSAGYVKDNRFVTPLKLGGAYGSNLYPGPDTIMAFIYNRGLTAAEMDSLNDWINSYCARRGI